jgi:hypothetical protein
MIAYDLRCSLAHGFEGWFASSSDYDAQLAAGLLQCPSCGDIVISKMITAPNVGRKGNQAAQIAQSERPGDSTPSNVQLPAETSEQPSLANLTVPEGMAEMITKLANLQNEVLKDSRWVGRKFADEARAMHYGEAEPQQIHGECSPQEAQTLADEGIAIAALPLPFIPPEAKN